MLAPFLSSDLRGGLLMKTFSKVTFLIRPAGAVVRGTLLVAAVTMWMVWLAGGFNPKTQRAGLPLPRADRSSGQTAALRRVSLPLTEEAVGTVKPVHEMVVTSRVAARITELKLTAGQQVSPDEILVRLDDRDLHARLAQAQAALQGAQAARDQ